MNTMQAAGIPFTASPISKEEWQEEERKRMEAMPRRVTVSEAQGGFVINNENYGSYDDLAWRQTVVTNLDDMTRVVRELLTRK